MSIKSIKTGFTGISALAGNDQWFGDFEAIASIVVGSGGTTDINFTSIPTTYTHLQLRGSLLGSSENQDYLMRVNGITAANSYSRHELRGNGTSATANGTANTSNFDFITNAAQTANPSVFIMDILDYANTNKYKTFRTISGTDKNGSGSISLQSALRLDTPAITSINIYASAGNINANSIVALYGIRG